MGDFVTIDSLKSWLGLTTAVYMIVAVIKSISPKKYSAWQLRGMAFLAGFAILLLVAVADGVFLTPLFASENLPKNLLNAGLIVINSFGLVISTAGFHEIYKGPQGQTVPPLYPDEPAPVPMAETERPAQDETLEKLEPVKESTTAGGDTPSPS